MLEMDSERHFFLPRHQEKRQRVGNLREVRYPADSCLPLLVTRWMALRFRFAVFFYSYENHCGYSLWSQPAFLLKQEEVPIVIYLLGWLQLTCASAQNTSEAWVWVQSSYFPFFLPKRMEPNKNNFNSLNTLSLTYIKLSSNLPNYQNSSKPPQSFQAELTNFQHQPWESQIGHSFPWSFGKDHCFSRDVYINYITIPNFNPLGYFNGLWLPGVNSVYTISFFTWTPCHESGWCFGSLLFVAVKVETAPALNRQRWQGKV